MAFKDGGRGPRAPEGAGGGAPGARRRPSPGTALRDAAARHDWARACALFTALRARPIEDWQAFGHAAALVQDWRGVLQAEAGWLAAAGATDPASQPAPALRLAISARLEWLLTEEARALAQAARQRHPHIPAFARQEATALARLGRHREAAELGRVLCEQGQWEGIRLATQALLARHDHAACAAFLAAAPGMGAAPPGALAEARAALLAARGDAPAALACAQAIPGLPPARRTRLRVQYAALAHDGAALDLLLREAADNAADPARLPLFLDTGSDVLLEHFLRHLNWAAVAPLAQALSARLLPPASARKLARVAEIAGERDLAHAVIARTVAHFPSAPMAWRAYVALLSVEGDAARLADLRAQMRAALPARVYAATMSISDPRGWDSAELPVLIAHNMAHPPGAQDGGVQNGGVQDGGVQDGGAHDGNAREGGAQDAGAQDGEAHDAGRATFFMLLRRLSLDAAQLAALPADDATQPPAVAAHLAFLRAPAADRALLARAAAAPVDFAAFTTNRDAAAARIAAAMAQLAATQRTRGRETLPLASQALVARAQAWPAPAHLLTAECYADAVATARHIVARIETATPSSVIRIGDGEGFFLPPAPRVAHRMAEDRVGIQSIWWGAARMDAARQEGILRDFMAALHAAGMIGIMPYRWFADSLHRDADETRYDRGTFNALHHVFGNLPDTNGLGAALTSTNFPLDLHNWGLWPAILRAAGSVSVVSCHDLAAALQARFGVHVRQAIRIPGEYRFQSAMAGAADPQASLLDQHGEVCDSLSPRLGELYLIAAGFLGKIHCDIVRARGGIAIDIGSLADYWMGFSTRAIRIAQEPAWNLADLRIRHHPLT